MGIIGLTKERILKEIGKGPIHGYELANRLKVPLPAIYEHLKNLGEEGLVERRESGRRRVYFLTDKGKCLLRVLEY
ncbi:unnamed protein product [marine sediment metagenome]|uniref:HTH arsR-type domain-containing protein n=1 Tax=marine sediment metagenome TaxID=412755 RepID=X1KCC7_9ZZZZ